MLDFVKFEVRNMLPEAIERNKYLDFRSVVECEQPDNIEGKIFAYYKGLKFQICPRKDGFTPRIIVEGSLHKYMNDGAHNYNDFSKADLEMVLNDIKNKFNIHPSNCLLKQLEIGVNFTPPVLSDNILSNCLLHKTKKFKDVYVKDEGNYRQASHEDYQIKIYDKKRHYRKIIKEKKPIVRFEIKFSRMRYLHQSEVYSIGDLMSFGIENLKHRLMLEWRNILFYDYPILTKTEYHDRYSNPNYWAHLNPSNFKYHRNKLNELIKLGLNSLKFRIEKIISEKFDSMTETDLNTSYYIDGERAV